MSHDLLIFDGVPASRCSTPIKHRPRPLRFVWHHILPKTCGGKTEAANLAELCDNCHYAVHDLMWRLANGAQMPARVDRGQLALATEGYNLAIAAGTVDRMPRESTS